jgi:hypothetical protein
VSFALGVMKKGRAIHLAGTSVLVACAALAFAGLLFRSTVYWAIPVQPGDAYGFGDVLDLLLYFAVTGMALVATALGLLLVVATSLGNRRLGLWLAAVGLGCIVAYQPLHSLMPRLVGP